MTVPSVPRSGSRLMAVAAIAALADLAPCRADPPSLEDRVDAHLRPYLETANFCGSVLIARDGRILLAEGLWLRRSGGESTQRPEDRLLPRVDVEDLHVGGHHVLEQEGRLSVEDPLSRHLPGWPRGDVAADAGDPL